MQRLPHSLALLLTAWIALTPAPRAIASDITIGWGDTLAPGCQDLDFDCISPDSAMLVVSFNLPAGVDSVYSLAGHVDFCTLPLTLPEWWRFDQVGGCREGAMEVTADFSAGPFTHEDPWHGQGAVDVEFIPGHMSPVRARVNVEITLDPPDVVSLAADTEYYAFALKFAPPMGACDGCKAPACFVINDFITILHSKGETRLYGNDYDNYARWQGGNGGCPFIVSVTPGSWGRIKGLYQEGR